MPRPANPTTPEAKLLTDALKAKGKGAQADVAIALELTPGAISQYASGNRPVPWDRAEALAKEVGLSASAISTEYRRALAHFLASQIERLTADTVIASEMVAKKLAGLSSSQRLDFEKHAGDIAKALRLTILKAIEMSEGSNVGTIQRDGEGSRFNRAAGTGKAGGEKPAEVSQRRKRAAVGSKHA